MAETCRHCGKSFASRSSLNRHVRSSVKCLVARGKMEPKKPKTILPCPACHQTFSRVCTMNVHLQSCVPLKIKQELESKHQAELEELRLKYELRIEGLEKELLVCNAQLAVQAENVKASIGTTNNQTNNYTIFYLGELTPEVGLLLADKIGTEQFWAGQRGIGRAFRDLRDAEGRKFFEVKDEQRKKYEVREGEQTLRDDDAVKLIKSVEKPVNKKILAISEGLYGDPADTERSKLIMEKTADCLNFSNEDENSKFLKALSSKNETLSSKNNFND